MFAKTIGLALLTTTLATNVMADTKMLEGRLVSVLSGSSFDFMADDKISRRVVVNGIVCPTKRDRGYESAKRAMKSALASADDLNTVFIRTVANDKYGRHYADVFFEGKSLATQLVNKGHCSYGIKPIAKVIASN